MSKNFLIDDDRSTLSIEHYIERLAVESSVYSDIIYTFKNLLPMLQTKTLDGMILVQGFISEDKSLLASFFSNEKKLENKYSNINYVNIGETLISVPEGFMGNLLEYSNALSEMSANVYSETIQTLQEYHVILSSFITNKEDQTSIKDHTDFFNRISGARRAIEDQIKKFIIPGNTSSKALFKNVISRISETKDIYTSVKKLQGYHLEANLKNIEAALFKINSLLDIVIRQMESQDITKISPKAGNNIALGAFEVGKYIELVSLFYFQCNIVLKISNDLFTLLDSKA